MLYLEQDVKKMVNNKNIRFFKENLKIKRKRTNKKTFWSGDLNPECFSIVIPAHNLNFEDDGIKLRQVS